MQFIIEFNPLYNDITWKRSVISIDDDILRPSNEGGFRSNLKLWCKFIVDTFYSQNLEFVVKFNKNLQFL